MTELIIVDDLAVDADTGEIVEWPAGAPGDGPGRIAYLIGLKRSAAEARNAYATAESVYQHVVNGLLIEAGLQSLKSEYGNATSVKAGVTRRAHAAGVATAVGAELLAHSEAEQLLLSAAKELDTKTVEQWIAGLTGDDAEALKHRQAVLRAVLISETPRGSYALITAPTKKPPRIERRRPEGELAEQLEQSVDRTGGAATKRYDQKEQVA